ncbi:hypothetical protein Tco_0046243 [Tanacetum coccineum]
MTSRVVDLTSDVRDARVGPARVKTILVGCCPYSRHPCRLPLVLRLASFSPGALHPIPFPLLFVIMSGSKPGEMALKSSWAVVMPKFDMHTYTSTLTLQELKDAVVAYSIPKDLHPRLPPSGLTMDKLPSCVDIPPTVSLFRVFYKLCKQGHWFSFENKIGGRLRKCFKEVTSSFKGWKKKFFLIDQRAIPDAMPWRHSDTDVRDDFPNNYNEEHADRLATPVVLLRPPPRLCYIYAA